MIKKNQIMRIYGTNYKQMTTELLEKSALCELIPKHNSTIGIKPNLVTASPAEFGATTHPEIVAAIIEYLQKHGFSDIVIAEGSWVGDRTADAFKYCGYEELADHYGVELFDTQKDSSSVVDCGDGFKLNICDITKRIDFLINVPVLKGHCQTRMTCALKNMKGLIPNSEKRRFHTIGLHEPIAYLQQAIRQDFIVVDHICGDLDFEEGGNPITKNCIMVSRDPVLVDSLACSILGLKPQAVKYLMLAEALGTGSTNLDKASIIDIGGSSSVHDEYHQSILDVSYSTDEVDSCSACYASLTAALIRLEREGLLEKLPERISIGQGFIGKTGKLGIGKCTALFDYNIPGCPPDSDAIYESLKSYICDPSQHEYRSAF